MDGQEHLKALIGGQDIDHEDAVSHLRQVIQRVDEDPSMEKVVIVEDEEDLMTGDKGKA